MKENIYKKLTKMHIVIAAAALAAAILMAVFIALSGGESTQTYGDTTDSHKDDDIDSGILPIPDDSTIAPDTAFSSDTADAVTEDTTLMSDSETVTPPSSEDVNTEPPEEPTKLQKAQAALDNTSLELIQWIDGAEPTYMTEAETDAEGNITSEAVSFKPPVAYFYMDMESGLSMEHNADHVFYTASIIKAPYVMWVLTEIERAENEGRADNSIYDVNSVFVYTADKYKSGSGIIQFEEYGTTYSYLELLELAVTKSDNVAFAELRNIYGRSGFNEFSKSIGVLNPTKNLYRATAAEMGAYMKAIYEYFESGSKYAALLANWMLSTNHRIMIPSSVKPTPVANKYGWDIDAYHDTAVVFDDHPYILVVMTELDNGRSAENNFIQSLVGRINRIHKEKLTDIR